MNARPYMTLYTGGTLYWDDLARGPYLLRDIAHGLSLTCRYAGQGREFYSVAQHSVLVSRIVPPEAALWGLFHDSAEAYMGDLQSDLHHLPELEGYRDLERQILSGIAQTFNLGPEPREDVKAADGLVVPYEMGSLGMLWHARLGDSLLSPSEAERAFLLRYEEIVR